MAILETGKKAPAFTLNNQNGEAVKLTSFKGEWLVVYFYPKAMTPGCTVQACGISSVAERYAEAGVHVLALSPDPVERLKKFENKHELKLQLLSDEDHKVAEKYGVWDLKKFMGKEFMGILRTTFIISPQQKIVHVINKVKTKTHHDDVMKIIEELKSDSAS